MILIKHRIIMFRAYACHFVKNVCRTFMNFKIKIFFLYITIVCIVLLLVYKSQFCCKEKLSFRSDLPVILWWTDGFPGTDNKIRDCSDGVKCLVTQDRIYMKDSSVDNYLFYGSNFKPLDLPLPRNAGHNVVWGLYHEESPRNVELFLHEESLKLFNYSATFSRYSDVPLTLQYLPEYNDILSNKYLVSTEDKNELLEKLSSIVYIQSDCETSTERDQYVQELMKYIKIDSYGECLHNKDLPDKFQHDYLNNLYDSEFMTYIARYKFAIAFENGVCEDYVTEKLWRPLIAGSVPVYFGSPSVRDWLPNDDSVVLVNDYRSPSDLAHYLKYLSSNNTAYEQHLKHKYGIVSNEKLLKTWQQNFVAEDVSVSVQNFECLICRQVYHRRADVKTKPAVITKKHYDCPKPYSALKQRPNPESGWVQSWYQAKVNAEDLYNQIVVLNKAVYVNNNLL